MILSALELEFKRKGAMGWHRNRGFNRVLGDNTIREKTLQEVDNEPGQLPYAGFIFYALIGDEC